MEVTYLWPPWLTGSYHPRFGDDATITVTAASSFTVAVRVPGWATAATVDGKAAPNGTLVEVPPTPRNSDPQELFLGRPRLGQEKQKKSALRYGFLISINALMQIKCHV
jgi:hypothetical protein